MSFVACKYLKLRNAVKRKELEQIERVRQLNRVKLGNLTHISYCNLSLFWHDSCSSSSTNNNGKRIIPLQCSSWRNGAFNYTITNADFYNHINNNACRWALLTHPVTSIVFSYKTKASTTTNLETALLFYLNHKIFLCKLFKEYKATYNGQAINVSKLY